jgi:hypothetical protein
VKAFLLALLLLIDAAPAPEGEPHRHALHLVTADAEPACTIVRLAGPVSAELGIGPPACIAGGWTGEAWMFDLCDRTDTDFSGRVLCVSQGPPGTILGGDFR